MHLTNKIIQVVFVQFLLLNTLSQAQSGISPNDIERAGQSGWQFLKINGDARQAAMGGAFAAISNGDANAIFGNPASLSDVTNIDVRVNVLQWVADIKYQSLAAAYNLGQVLYRIQRLKSMPLFARSIFYSILVFSKYRDKTTSLSSSN